MTSSVMPTPRGAAAMPNRKPSLVIKDQLLLAAPPPPISKVPTPQQAAGEDVETRQRSDSGLSVGSNASPDSQLPMTPPPMDGTLSVLPIWTAAGALAAQNGTNADASSVIVKKPVPPRRSTSLHKKVKSKDDQVGPSTPSKSHDETMTPGDESPSSISPTPLAAEGSIEIPSTVKNENTQAANEVVAMEVIPSSEASGVSQQRHLPPHVVTTPEKNGMPSDSVQRRETQRMAWEKYKAEQQQKAAHAQQQQQEQHQRQEQWQHYLSSPTTPVNSEQKHAYFVHAAATNRDAASSVYVSSEQQVTQRQTSQQHHYQHNYTTGQQQHEKPALHKFQAKFRADVKSTITIPPKTQPASNTVTKSPHGPIKPAHSHSSNHQASPPPLRRSRSTKVLRTAADFLEYVGARPRRGRGTVDSVAVIDDASAAVNQQHQAQGTQQMKRSKSARLPASNSAAGSGIKQDRDPSLKEALASQTESQPRQLDLLSSIPNAPTLPTLTGQKSGSAAPTYRWTSKGRLGVKGGWGRSIDSLLPTTPLSAAFIQQRPHIYQSNAEVLDSLEQDRAAATDSASSTAAATKLLDQLISATDRAWWNCEFSRHSRADKSPPTPLDFWYSTAVTLLLDHTATAAAHPNASSLFRRTPDEAMAHTALVRRAIILHNGRRNGGCPRCGEDVPESAAHLLLLCPAASLLWTQVAVTLSRATGVNVGPTVSLEDVVLGFPRLKSYLTSSVSKGSVLTESDDDMTSGDADCSEGEAGDAVRVVTAVHAIALHALFSARSLPHSDPGAAASLFRVRFTARATLEADEDEKEVERKILGGGGGVDDEGGPASRLDAAVWKILFKE